VPKGGFGVLPPVNSSALRKQTNRAKTGGKTEGPETWGFGGSSVKKKVSFFPSPGLITKKTMGKEKASGKTRGGNRSGGMGVPSTKNDR